MISQLQCKTIQAWCTLSNGESYRSKGVAVGNLGNYIAMDVQVLDDNLNPVELGLKDLSIAEESVIDEMDRINTARLLSTTLQQQAI